MQVIPVGTFAIWSIIQLYYGRFVLLVIFIYIYTNSVDPHSNKSDFIVQLKCPNLVTNPNSNECVMCVWIKLSTFCFIFDHSCLTICWFIISHLTHAQFENTFLRLSQQQGSLSDVNQSDNYRCFYVNKIIVTQAAPHPHLASTPIHGETMVFVLIQRRRLRQWPSTFFR